MDLSQLPSPFYRVTTRAIILTPDGKLVLVEDHNHEFQLPGGGWEHSESFEDCVRREVQEELSVEVESIGPVLFTYRQLDRRGFVSLRLAAKVVPKSYDFKAGDDMIGVRTVTQAEFRSMELCPGEGPIQQCSEQIWGATAV